VGGAHRLSTEQAREIGPDRLRYETPVQRIEHDSQV
jgi:hypothetical protein